MGCSGSNVKPSADENKKPSPNDAKEENQGAKNPPSSGVGEIQVKGAQSFYTGILADNGMFYGNKLFVNQDEVNDFKNSIATQKVEYIDRGEGVMPGVKYVKNDTDAFLQGQVKVDFSRQRLIICQGSRLSSIEEKNNKLLIKFDTVTMVRENYYYAYVVNSKLNELDFESDRPREFEDQTVHNRNMVIEQRPINNRVIEQRPMNNRIIEQRPVNNRIIEQRPINDNEFIEQRPINDNEYNEQMPVNNEEFTEEPVEYADKKVVDDQEYAQEDHAEGEYEYEEA